MEDLDLGEGGFLEIRDGDKAAAPLLAKFEGSAIRTSIVISTSNAVRLYLHSQQQFNGKGFKCSYMEGEYSELNTAYICRNELI